MLNRAAAGAARDAADSRNFAFLHVMLGRCSAEAAVVGVVCACGRVRSVHLKGVARQTCIWEMWFSGRLFYAFVALSVAVRDLPRKKAL